MNITINSSMFDLLFFAIMFLFSLDFTLSSILAIRNFERKSRIPFPLGLWMIKQVVSFNPFKGQSNFGSWLYSPKVIAFSFLIGGTLIVFASLIMILNILVTKTLFSVN